MQSNIKYLTCAVWCLCVVACACVYLTTVAVERMDTGDEITIECGGLCDPTVYPPNVGGTSLSVVVVSEAHNGGCTSLGDRSQVEVEARAGLAKVAKALQGILQVEGSVQYRIAKPHGRLSHPTMQMTVTILPNTTEDGRGPQCIKLSDGAYQCTTPPSAVGISIGASVAQYLGAASLKHADLEKWESSRRECLCGRISELLGQFYAVTRAVPRLVSPESISILWSDFLIAKESGDLTRAYDLLVAIVHHPDGAPVVSFPIEQLVAMTLPILLPVLVGTIHTLVMMVKRSK